MSEPSQSTKEWQKGKVNEVLGGTSKKANITGVIRERTQLLPQDEEEEKKVLRTIKIHVASENYTVMEDGVVTSPNGTDLNIVNKKSGVGFIIRNNGDIMIQSGGGEGGKYCGGRFLINTKGGQLVKSGPIVQEITSQGKSAVEGEGGENDKDQTGSSKIVWGNDTEEIHGNKHIRGRQITIDAGDVLTLMAKESIILQAGPEGGGEIQLKAGLVKTTADIIESNSSKEDIVTKERTLTQFDPRGSDNFISVGHRNVRCLGDLNVDVGGIISTKIMGGTPWPPLVKGTKRKSSLNVSVIKGNISMMTNIGSMLMSAGAGAACLIPPKPGAFTVTAKTSIKQEAKTAFTAKALGSEFSMGGGDATDPTSGAAIGGEIELSAAMKLTLKALQGASLTSGNGPLVITGTPIYLN